MKKVKVLNVNLPDMSINSLVMLPVENNNLAGITKNWSKVGTLHVPKKLILFKFRINISSQAVQNFKFNFCCGENLFFFVAKMGNLIYKKNNWKIWNNESKIDKTVPLFLSQALL